MYQIYVDGDLFCTSRADDVAVIDPVVTLEANKAGSFVFLVAPAHPYYDKIRQRTSLINVFQNDEQIFSGIATEIEDDLYQVRTIRCEGELTFFNDSVQRPAKYTGRTSRQLLEAYVAAHNSQTEAAKHFTVGTVTATDPNNSISCYTNYETTMECIGADLIDDIGGYLRIRHENGQRILDYLAASPNTNSQVIAIGKNLMDFVQNRDTLDLCTVLIPLGARLETQTVEGLEDRLTIKSVNGGADYIEAADAIAAFGRITKVVKWDDVTIPANLLRKGQEYLQKTQFEHMVIEATAFDLSLASSVFEQIKLLDTIRVVSEPHQLDQNFVVTKLEIHLNDPDKNTVRLGEEKNLSISARSAKNTESVRTSVETAISEAVANATALITSAMGGYVYKTQSELYIMDTNDPETATRVWRWNLNGLGYSATGIGGPYIAAMTMDGVLQGIEIVGTRGSIGGWTISSGAIYKDVIDPSNPAHIYRVYFQPNNTSNPTGTWILSCQESTNSGVNFSAKFRLMSNGDIYFGNSKLYSNGKAEFVGTSDKVIISPDSSAYGTSEVAVVKGNTKVITMNERGFRLYDNRGNQLAFLENLDPDNPTGGLYIYDANTHFLRARIMAGGLQFFKSDGSFGQFYGE